MRLSPWYQHRCHGAVPADATCCNDDESGTTLHPLLPKICLDSDTSTRLTEQGSGIWTRQWLRQMSCCTWTETRFAELEYETFVSHDLIRLQKRVKLRGAASLVPLLPDSCLRHNRSRMTGMCPLCSVAGNNALLDSNTAKVSLYYIVRELMVIVAQR